MTVETPAVPAASVAREPLVVFAHHREVQAAVCERFPDAAHLLGSDDTRGRRAAIEPSSTRAGRR